MALVAPLPPGWTEATAADLPAGSSSGAAAAAPELQFKDAHGVLHDEHPLDNYFRELIRRRQRELLRRKRAALKAVQAVVAMGGLRRRLEAAAGG